MAAVTEQERAHERREHLGVAAGVLIGALGVVIIGLAIVWQSYQGRVDLVNQARAVCVNNQRFEEVPQQNVNRSNGSDLVDVAMEDHFVDPKYDGRLNPTDKKLVAQDHIDGQGYTCLKAHPEASILGFHP